MPEIPAPQPQQESAGVKHVRAGDYTAAGDWFKANSNTPDAQRFQAPHDKVLKEIEALNERVRKARDTAHDHDELARLRHVLLFQRDQGLDQPPAPGRLSQITTDAKLTALGVGSTGLGGILVGAAAGNELGGEPLKGAALALAAETVVAGGALLVGKIRGRGRMQPPPDRKPDASGASDAVADPVESKKDGDLDWDIPDDPDSPSL